MTTVMLRSIVGMVNDTDKEDSVVVISKSGIAYECDAEEFVKQQQPLLEDDDWLKRNDYTLILIVGEYITYLDLSQVESISFALNN